MRWSAFWRGFRSLTIFPPERPRKPLPRPVSDAEAIRGDWEQVGKDLRNAMAKEQEASPYEKGGMASALYGMTSADALSRDECPFPEGSPERTEWLKGWDEQTEARRKHMRMMDEEM